ncbi:methyltransferase domain-containing protein [Sphingomonas montanisoli]|uniref:Methyltransferase domain-containing protein n=1 Tax=Sphingomonas montanisoli TaxID=2606412 RepID=A0A5D9CGW3_9SPHN|nr:methyltransferase domain-containing protein [Sphingomonas montanisoli]
MRTLSPAPARRTSARVDNPEIFDRALRRLRRDRAARIFADHAFLIDHMADELAERLSAVQREFKDVLILGSHDGRVALRFAAPGRTIVQADAGARFASWSDGTQADEDQPAFAAGSFDLVISVGVLDQVNDLPGALALIRRALRPDGLFLGAFLGAGTLEWLRSATLAADMAVGESVSPRIHPQIDVRSAGDLLSRAGFSLQVADGERIDVGYGDPLRLIGDLRGMAATNILANRDRRPLTRAWLTALFETFAADAGADGRLRERFEIVYMTGWSPDASQPKPAKRGSATASLAAALKKG